MKEIINSGTYRMSWSKRAIALLVVAAIMFGMLLTIPSFNVAANEETDTSYLGTYDFSVHRSVPSEDESATDHKYIADTNTGFSDAFWGSHRRFRDDGNGYIIYRLPLNPNAHRAYVTLFAQAGFEVLVNAERKTYDGVNGALPSAFATDGWVSLGNTGKNPDGHTTNAQQTNRTFIADVSAYRTNHETPEGATAPEANAVVYLMIKSIAASVNSNNEHPLVFLRGRVSYDFAATQPFGLDYSEMLARNAQTQGNNYWMSRMIWFTTSNPAQGGDAGDPNGSQLGEAGVFFTDGEAAMRYEIPLNTTLLEYNTGKPAAEQLKQTLLIKAGGEKLGIHYAGDRQYTDAKFLELDDGKLLPEETGDDFYRLFEIDVTPLIMAGKKAVFFQITNKTYWADANTPKAGDSGNGGRIFSIQTTTDGNEGTEDEKAVNNVVALIRAIPSVANHFETYPRTYYVDVKAAYDIANTAYLALTAEQNAAIALNNAPDVATLGNVLSFIEQYEMAPARTVRMRVTSGGNIFRTISVPLGDIIPASNFTNIAANRPSRTGYTFNSWGTAAQRTGPVQQNRDIVANWTANRHTITVKAQTGGTVKGGGAGNYGTSRTVTASPRKGYNFTGWFEGSKRVSSSRSYRFTITKNRTLQARFAAIRVKTIRITSGNRTLNVRKSFNLKTSINPSTALNKKVTWRSANSRIVKVNSKGRITAVRKGRANITVTTNDGNKKATIRVTVR